MMETDTIERKPLEGDARALMVDWIDDLRSGKYAQGRATLRTLDDKYCCLGVLCNRIAPNAWLSGPHAYTTIVDDIGYMAYVSVPLMRRLGKHFDAGELTVMNDRGESFAEIADYLEATYL